MTCNDYGCPTHFSQKVSKILEAVQTVFGWRLQRIKMENKIALTMNIIIEKNLIF